jgi:hypothetical protein
MSCGADPDWSTMAGPVAVGDGTASGSGTARLGRRCR